jgi:thiol:disulfide interchange protein
MASASPVAKRRSRLQFSISILLLWMVPIACGADIARRWWQDYQRRRPLAWETYSAEGLEKHRSEGRTVLLHFTADWTPNVQLNYVVAINVPRVNNYCRAHDIAPVMIDCSSMGPEVKALLREYGSMSIPLTVIIPGATPDEPIVLRDLLTEDQVLRALEEAVSRERDY